ncbi:MAG TPA: TetR/AcrR family transcriptional regulator [Streptosporangiaceae bacterium]
MTEQTVAQRRESPARRRVLDTAAGLFYAEGVHTVGIDRIIAEARVAKATFYHHFPAKDDLVSAYIQEHYGRQRQAVEAIRAAAAPPRETLLKIFDYMGVVGAGPTYRGCPFINAAAEYPDPAHPVRQAIADFRCWARGMFRELLTEAGHPDPEGTAAILMMLRDGITVGSDLDDFADPDALRAVIRDAVVRVVDP